MSKTYDYQEMNHDLDIVKSRVFRRPDAAFFGPLLCSLDFVWDTTVPTAATDGEKVYWGPDDFLRCVEQDKGEGESTLMHELWHVGRLHDIRCGDRCPDTWNKACDIKINRDLRAEGYYIGPDWLERPDIKLELEEDIYDFLKKEGGGVKKGKCAHGQIPTNVKATVAAVAKAVHAAKTSGSPGSVPGNTETVLSNFLAPIIPWEKHLRQWMSDLAHEEYTWARPNRRHGASGLYLPSRYMDEGRLAHLVYFQDVSGSISDNDIKRFNSELKYVWDYFKPKKMTVIQFDTIIQAIDEFKEGDSFDKIKIVGRGGTSLVCVREKILELKPTAAVIFSDMCVAPMQKLPVEIPILWVATNAPGATVPFGKLIHIKT